VGGTVAIALVTDFLTQIIIKSTSKGLEVVFHLQC